MARAQFAGGLAGWALLFSKKMQKIVWIIEDNLMLGQTISDYLTSKRFTCKTFDNGEDAIACFSKEIPDLIICDMMLPGISGLQVLKKFSAINTTNWVPFIFLSAVKYENTHREALNLGADDYITKPFTFEELMGSINARLKRSELEQNSKKEAQQKIEELSLQLAELKMLVNHKVRSYASKIWVKKKELDDQIEDPQLKQLIFAETKKILDITEGAKTIIPKKTKPKEKPIIKSNCTIFLIDDERFSLFILEKFFSSALPNLKVKSFSNPIVGLKELELNPPDLLVLDLMMPEMDGFTVLKEMEKRNLNVPVIIHSSTSNQIELDQTKKFSNVKGIVGKPIKPDLLKLSVENILSL